jgi:hypothetical protein
MDKPKELGPAETYAYILYVESKKDSLVRYVADKGLLPVVYIQDVHLLRYKPEYLKTLPVLVNTSTKTGYLKEALIQELDRFEPPPSMKKAQSSGIRTRELWARDTQSAEETTFEARSAPLHVRR